MRHGVLPMFACPRPGQLFHYIDAVGIWLIMLLFQGQSDRNPEKNTEYI